MCSHRGSLLRHWLAFTCSISPRAARDHVRVAARLAPDEDGMWVGGYTLERARDGSIVVLTPLRHRIAAIPRNRRGDCAEVPRTDLRRGLDPPPGSLRPTDGGPFDLDLAVDAMAWFTRSPNQPGGP
jgi:hypothetical protein